MFLLQDDIVEFVSEPASPPRLVEIPEEGKGKVKEHREVGEGKDTVIVEDTSDEHDEETLQERFQLRSRFSRPKLPNVPLIQDPPTSLEASLPAPPRRPRNMACKRVAKKLKVTETTSQEVKYSSRVVEYFASILCMLRTKFCCLQEIPPPDPVDQGDEGDWDTVGEPVERSRSLAPTVEELVSQLTHQSTTVVELQAPVVEGRTEPTTTPAAEEPAATEAEEEVHAEAGLVDIASILGAPTVILVRSSL
jgi:hypothetical protein